MAQEQTNPFILLRKYPNVDSILKGHQAGLGDYANCLFVLDANTLLAPYGLKKDGIDKIKSIYASLVSANKLFVPMHAMREFADNRPSKISDIFSNIDKALSAIPGWKDLDYPILNDLDSFQKLSAFKETFKSTTKQYREHLQALADEVINWDWQDPITKLYAEIFNKGIFIDTDESEENLLKDFSFRTENNIPPGFKDKTKSENGIGDLLIWKSILKLGGDKKVDLIFVTNDEKPDWFVQGNGKAIITRFELVDEYYRMTGGKSFACMNFSSFLALQGAAPTIVADVEKAAKRDVAESENRLFQIDNTESSSISTPTSINTLTKIPGKIRLFLRSDSEDEGYFLPEEIADILELFCEQYIKERPKYNPSISEVLTTIYSVLKTIIKESYEIESEWYGQNRVSFIKQKSLEALCRNFLDIYTEFANIYTGRRTQITHYLK
jgi:hypothetical protein